MDGPLFEKSMLEVMAIFLICFAVFSAPWEWFQKKNGLQLVFFKELKSDVFCI